MKKDPLLDRTILQLSETDVLPFRRLIEGGTLITGGLGSGKSSTSGRALAMGFLRAGLGGLICTVKSDETQHWIEYAKACGREKDLTVFNAESNLSFDPLAYSWNAGGTRAAAYLETIIELFTTLIAIGKPKATASSESRYFENAVEVAMRCVLVMLSLGGERISILSIHKIIVSLPTRPEEIEEEPWRQTDCGKLVASIKARQDSFTESQWQDLDNALTFALKQWPEMDPRTRSSIESTWVGMADKFAYDPFRRMYCSGSFDFTPEQITHERKILILDQPVLEFGKQASQLCQVLTKMVFQRAWLRHQYKPGCCNGAFIFQDEFSLLMHKHEGYFAQVCRGSAIAQVCLTTNILTIAAEEFGESRPGSRTLGFLGNLSVKIFHHQTDVETRNYAADLIGKEYKDISSWNAGGQQAGASVGAQKQLVHILEPLELTKLSKPDAEDPCAEAIVYTGDTFNATQTPYLRVLFSRDI
jgi:hypothetical protein